MTCSISLIVSASHWQHSDTHTAMWVWKTHLGVVVRYWSIHKEVKSKRRAQEGTNTYAGCFFKTYMRTQETLRVQSDAKQRFYILKSSVFECSRPGLLSWISPSLIGGFEQVFLKFSESPFLHSLNEDFSICLLNRVLWEFHVMINSRVLQRLWSKGQCNGQGWDSWVNFCLPRNSPGFQLGIMARRKASKHPAVKCISD